MRRSFAAASVVAAALLAAGASAQWQYGPNTGFAFTRFDGIYYPGDALVYFLGGRLADSGTSGQIWSFDPAALTYADTGVVMPNPVSNFTLQMLDDGTQTGIYLIGGRLASGTSIGYVQVYYPDTNTATRIAADDWPAAPARIPGAVVEYGNKLYVFGGFNSAGPTYMYGDTWVYDPALPEGSRWTQAASANLALARSYIYACEMDGYIYAFGGDVWDGSTLIPQTKAERLDPADLEAGWDDASVADLATATAEGQTFGFDSGAGHGLAGHIILVGGGVWPDQSTACYDYDVMADSYSSFSSLNLARRNHAGVVTPAGMDLAMWVFGGRYLDDTSVTQTAERYLVDWESQPTRTPTPAPTATPVPPTATPTGAATATPALELGVRLELPVSVSPGEQFYVTGYLDNPGADLADVPTFFILGVYGEFFFWPSWTRFVPPDTGDIDFLPYDVPTGSTPVEVLAAFTWPDTGPDTVSGLAFYGAMLNAEMSDLLGNLAMQEWGYGP